MVLLYRWIPCVQRLELTKAVAEKHFLSSPDQLRAGLRTRVTDCSAHQPENAHRDSPGHCPSVASFVVHHFEVSGRLEDPPPVGQGILTGQFPRR